MYPGNTVKGKPGNIGILFFLSALLAAGALFSGCLKESSLAVTGMDVAADSVTGSTVLLNVTTSVTNQYGFGNGDLRFMLRAYDTGTGLLAGEREDRTGSLGKGQTATFSQGISLPRSGSYRLTSTIFEGQMQKARSEIEVRNLERLPTDRGKGGVDIDDIDFIVKGLSAGRATIESDMYFTNKGQGPSSAYDVEVRAREMDAHLIADKKWTTVDPVNPEATVIRSVDLSVPDQYNYAIEVLLWQDQVIVKRGEGTVLLRPGSTLQEGERFETKSIETSRFVAETPLAQRPADMPTSKAQPGFGAALAFAGLAGAALAMRRR